MTRLQGPYCLTILIQTSTVQPQQDGKTAENPILSTWPNPQLPGVTPGLWQPTHTNQTAMRIGTDLGISNGKSADLHVKSNHENSSPDLELLWGRGTSSFTHRNQNHSDHGNKLGITWTGSSDNGPNTNPKYYSNEVTTGPNPRKSQSKTSKRISGSFDGGTNCDDQRDNACQPTTNNQIVGTWNHQGKRSDWNDQIAREIKGSTIW